MSRYAIALLCLTLAVGGLYLLAGEAAYAAVTGSNVSIGETGRFTETSAGKVNASGGNVTLVNLTATVSTDKWQGFYGNVSGSLSLGYGSDSFYDFSAAVPLYVYASQNSSFNWTAIAAVNSSEVDTVWGYDTATDNDQAADVFNISREIAGVRVNATELNGAGGDWWTGLFSDGTSSVKGNFAFGCNVSNTAKQGFDGSNYHYQMMVPVNVTREEYYFFMEI